MRDLDVKKIRLKIGLTQDKFGLLLGVSRGSVAKWESQETKPAMDNAFKMLEIDSRFNSGEKNLIQNLLQGIKPVNKTNPAEKEDKKFSDLKIDDKLNVIYKMLGNTLNEIERIEKTNN